MLCFLLPEHQPSQTNSDITLQMEESYSLSEQRTKLELEFTSSPSTHNFSQIFVVATLKLLKTELPATHIPFL